MKWSRQFQYIVHIKNLKEILERGILSHNRVELLGLKPEKVSNPQVMELRKHKPVEADKTLWDYANLYFKARNPMLWKVITDFGVDNVVVLGLRPTTIRLPGARLTDGNAASFSTKISLPENLKEVYTSIRDDLDSDYWKSTDDSKRKVMAECLVPDEIPADYISSIKYRVP